MPRRTNKTIRGVKNRGQHQRRRTTRGHRTMSKFKKYKYYEEGGDIMRCESCGGEILGDGYTEVRHCENANVPIDAAPDDPIILCGMSEKEVIADRLWFWNNFNDFMKRR